MAWKWIPWKYLLRRLARAHGFLDPISLMSRLERFSQPSEVSTPLELLRAGSLFHARGLMNTKTIQHNLDWVWPYWVQRQFDPADDSFLPRAFSITHVNLTHRNWTAVGLPQCEAMPLVDPRGLLTPLLDGWSLDAWVVSGEGRSLLPATLARARQKLLIEEDRLAVWSRFRQASMGLDSTAWVEQAEGKTTCVLHLDAEGQPGDWLALAVRPFNPEGVSFVHEIALDANARCWTIDRTARVEFDRPSSRHYASVYSRGDVHMGLLHRSPRLHCRCDAGMATAAALFPIEHDRCELTARIDLTGDPASSSRQRSRQAGSWSSATEGLCDIDVPDEKFAHLFRVGLRTLLLLSPEDPVPGPYTYKRFWFRDAAYMLHAMLCMGMVAPVTRAIRRFPSRQRVDGYFHSQYGEWDSNGQVLWLLDRYRRLTGQPLGKDWPRRVIRAARWIQRKRLSRRSDKLEAGLMPAGFSAEHLGNNDFYYWDDYWSVAGLRSAAGLCRRWDKDDQADTFDAEASDLVDAIETSLQASRYRRSADAIPASPYRRLDTGAVGSLVAGYPLRLVAHDDKRLLATADHLVRHCTVRGAFFQDMIHSGLNAYLTLHLAQVLLRAGDPRFARLVRAVADLASPTGQWPEAVHPRTGGGCMGDGQHGWAAADWLMMIRNLFVREEGRRLIIGSGIPRVWLDQDKPMHLGPTATEHGPLTLWVLPAGNTVTVRWQAQWRHAPPQLAFRLPDTRPHTVRADRCQEVTLDRLVPAPPIPKEATP
jgi:hypothetical protein